MTRATLMATMDPEEFDEWQHLERIEPYGTALLLNIAFQLGYRLPSIGRISLAGEATTAEAVTADLENQRNLMLFIKNQQNAIVARNKKKARV